MSVGQLSTNGRIATPGSLRAVLDGMQALQAQLPSMPDLVDYDPNVALGLYRWQPDSAEFPALWNWLLPSSAEMRDTARLRDTINLSTRIGITWSDVESRMGYVEAAADAYRQLIDPAFWRNGVPPAELSAFATRGWRAQMQSFSDTIGSVPVLGIEFVQTIAVDRMVF